MWVVLAGAVVGVIFDFYRSLRCWMGWGPISTFVGDLFFSIIALLILLQFFWKVNALDFRLYIIWGSLSGLLIYQKLFSRIYIKIFFNSFRMIEYLAHLVWSILKFPYKLLVILMKPPYAVLRWVSMLTFRVGEALFSEPVRRVEKRAQDWWNNFFPPRTNG